MQILNKVVDNATLTKELNTMTKETSYLVFSVFQSNVDDFTNYKNHLYIKTKLGNYKEIVGVYKDTAELSFMVPFSEIHKVQEICTKFNQESYLELETNGLTTFASLVYLDDKAVEFLGVLTETIQEPETDCYTYDQSNDKYYVTQKISEVA